MKPWILVVSLISALISIVGCRNDSAIDSSLYAVEVIDGVRHVHNYKAQRGDRPEARLELLGKIGQLEAKEERNQQTLARRQDNSFYRQTSSL
jgi:hypothetical protein